MNKKTKARLRRAKRSRAKIRELNVPSLSVHRTGKYLYAQIISADGKNTLAAASSLEKGLVDGEGTKKNMEAAKKVGAAIAERALKAGIDSVAFDRSGFLYHGKIKALADAAREAGLKF